MVNNLTDSGYQEFISQLGSIITTRFHNEDVSDIADFARNYFFNSYLGELLEKPIEDVYGEVISTWQFVEKFDGEKTKVRILNPTIENDGWQSTHTVIEVIMVDMPFIVDSIRMAINKRDITIHSLINTVLDVERNDSGILTNTSVLVDSTEKKGRKESILHIEIDRQSNADKRLALEDEISSILSDLHLLVHDFPKMLEKVNEAKAERESLQGSDEDALNKSYIDLLDWLRNDNFTFLGYREYRYETKEKVNEFVGITGSELGTLKTDKEVDLLDDVSDCSLLTRETLIFAKSSTLSRIHRPAYPELLIVNRVDIDGNIIGQHRFLGLFTARVFNQDPNNIPIVRDKITAIIQKTGLNRSSHDYKQLQNIIGNLPKVDLFQASLEQLFETAAGILRVKERPWVKLFVHPGPFRRFVSCIIYAPRDRYSTEMRKKFQSILSQVFSATDLNFSTQFSESILVQVHVVLKVSPDKHTGYEINEIERRLVDVCRSWEDDLHGALHELMGEEESAIASTTYLHSFVASYKEDFLPRLAVADIRHMMLMTADRPLGLSFYRAIEDPKGIFRFKLFHLEKLIPLSDVIPVLENLGLRILGERPYEVRRKNKEAIWIHDFTVCYGKDIEISLDKVKDYFQSAFRQIWRGHIENDGFNRLVLGSGLKWQEVMLLRGYAKYLKQVCFPFSQSYIEEALVSNHTITNKLLTLFKVRFDPEAHNDRSENEAICIQDLKIALDDVDNLDEDRILRRFMEVILGTIRTNFFQWSDTPSSYPYLAFKFDPEMISDLPLPRPMFEIFVYSARVEGVHLRGGKVARGGLRWSDRMEDFRTEVLGLVKAQQVKNSVIVPVGAKGGFVCKRLPENATRETTMAEVISCYQLFISALLDITDNLVEGKVVPPENVVCKDRSDPYLVVAADKGTATFSDIANQISTDRNFWLGDAFASGGSVGYDHKKMGITAKGAWVSVQRHFREIALNTQEQSFTVVGIGDMSGDVFGNGMLLSKEIKLVAAFNHLDIFIDPNPDTAKSFKERTRLFGLPRSRWKDYKAALISKGGGVFPRRAKSIKITPEMKACFDISSDKLTPNALISALLTSPVDLVWNGGIGTYIKAKSEQHVDVGDKANDALRVNADDMRCRVFGEGGNLGVTQLARVEMALNGIAVNADFIDNSAGVDCSDHEVNIKILLNEVVNNGELTTKQRSKMLETMTDEVSELVLRNNYRQAQAISISESLSPNRLEELRRYIHYLEGKGKLNRRLEFLPSDEEIQERKKLRLGLMRPELSVLLSYSKNLLKEQLIDSSLLSDPFISSQIETAFPKLMSVKFKPQMYEHRLKSEIIATQLANSIVNDMGITYIIRMHDASGAEPADIAKAYMIAKSIYQLDDIWNEVQDLDYKISTGVQIKMMTDVSRVVRRATRWFLRNRRGDMDVQAAISHFQPKVTEIRDDLSDYIQGPIEESFNSSVQALVEQGVPDTLAMKVASTSNMLSFLGVIEASDITGHSLDKVAKLYFMLGDELELHWFRTQIHQLEINNHWQALARETFREDLDWQQRALTVSVLEADMDENSSLEQCITLWKRCHHVLLKRWGVMVDELKSGDSQEFSMYAVALRELLDIAQSASYSCGTPGLESDEENSR